MRILNRLLSIGVLAVILTFLVSGSALAVGPYSPTADTYTDIIHPDANHGGDINLSLNASNLTSCLATTYLWFKFDIPATAAQIKTAELSLTFNPAGAGPIDMELHSASESWNEDELTWNTQAGLLDPTILATVRGNIGITATFSTTELASYLNAHKGQTVSLVAYADCSGTVPPSGALAVASKENPSGSSVSLGLYGPTNVILVNLTARSTGSTDVSDLIIILLITGLVVMGLVLINRYRIKHNPENG